ncbi:hypothetical protein WDW89_01535 [Deltaproteobacteria bacterium TL4]
METEGIRPEITPGIIFWSIMLNSLTYVSERNLEPDPFIWHPLLHHFFNQFEMDFIYER